jgi:membrane protein
MADFEPESLIARAKASILGIASMAGVVSFAGFVRYAAERFATRQTLRVAASLSYTSLLALVPLAAIGVAVMSAFPVFDSAKTKLGDLVFNYVAPHAGLQVQEYLDRFVGNTTQLTTIGVVGLAATTLLLLSTIEGAFNVIWGVAEKRSFVTRLVAYWTTVTLGPFLLGAGISLSTYLFAIDLGGVGLGGVREVVVAVLPWLLTTTGFTVLYVALPARSVQWRHALGGAIVAAILFEGLKSGFGAYVGAAGGFTSIYGPLAALPLFLIWMYLAWAVILFGAVLSAAWPEWQSLRRETADPATPARQLMRALLVLQHLRAAGSDGETVDDEMLLRDTGGSNVALGEVLGKLRAAGFTARTEAGCVVLARDLDGVTLHDIRRALGLGVGELDTSDVGSASWKPAFDRIIRSWAEADRRVLDVPVKALIDGERDGPMLVADTRLAGDLPGKE